ncbi:unnamed protein product [Somion occarium]
MFRLVARITMLSWVPLLTRLVALASSTGSHGCKCISTDDCWPDASAFAKLASEVSQPLVQPFPTASACYPVSDPSGNCTEVQTLWGDGNWRSNQAGSMQESNYETFTFDNGTISACYRDTALGVPCEQGSVPVIGVDARTLEDVQAGVKFARVHNLRLVVKNTGHDFLGRSAGRGSFVIWTHHMKNITVHDTFTPFGGRKNEKYSQAITLGAGVQWHEAYDAANGANRTLVGGLSAGGSVGAAGGWLLGGGHSALSPTYGLGVDNVLEISIVVASGEHIKANSHKNTDLFWALRGGGGGTYGIVTSVTYRTHPLQQVIAGFLTTSIKSSTPGTPPILVKLISEFFRMSPNLSDAGWGGYGLMAPSAPGESLAMQFVAIAPNSSWSAANDSFLPLIANVASLAANSSIDDGGLLNITFASTFPVESFHAWLTQFIDSGTAETGGNVMIGSRLLPKALLDVNSTRAAETWLGLPGITFHLVAGGAVSKTDPDATGLNPAWRKGVLHAAFGSGWPEGTSSADIEQIANGIKQNLTLIENLSPNAGAYLNEASLFETDFQQTFFGNHYHKLKAIKKRYDPTDLFIVPKGVGSEDWDEQLHCRRRK